MNFPVYKNEDDIETTIKTLPLWFDTFDILFGTVRKFNVSKVEDEHNAMVMESIFYDINRMARYSLYKYAQTPTVKDFAFEISMAASKLRDISSEKGEKLSFFARRELKEVRKIINFVEAHLTDAAVSMRRYEGVSPGSEDELIIKKRNKLFV